MLGITSKRLKGQLSAFRNKYDAFKSKTQFVPPPFFKIWVIINKRRWETAILAPADISQNSEPPNDRKGNYTHLGINLRPLRLSQKLSMSHLYQKVG